MAKDENSSFEKLNNELIPLIHKYKKLQETYINAVNNGGCYISIEGNCSDHALKTNHPYFNDPLQNNSLNNCLEQQEQWKHKCSNNNIDSIYIDSSKKNILEKTNPIRKQLGSINVLIINKLKRMKKIVNEMDTFEKKNIFGKNKKTLMRDIDELTKERMNMQDISNEPNYNLIKKANSNYLKYLFSLCLVIFLGILLFYSLQTEGFLITEFIIVTIIIIYLREITIPNIIIDYFYEKLF